MDREAEIQDIAYRLWKEEGMPGGRDMEIWLRAESMWRLDNEASAAPAPKRKTASAPKPRSASGKASARPRKGGK